MHPRLADRCEKTPVSNRSSQAGTSQRQVSDRSATSQRLASDKAATRQQKIVVNPLLVQKPASALIHSAEAYRLVEL